MKTATAIVSIIVLFYATMYSLKVEIPLACGYTAMGNKHGSSHYSVIFDRQNKIVISNVIDFYVFDSFIYGSRMDKYLVYFLLDARNDDLYDLMSHEEYRKLAKENHLPIGKGINMLEIRKGYKEIDWLDNQNITRDNSDAN